ncbi:hypothetical protein HYE67_002985 [Fusarium culmorum]|uniref:DUF7908 domain-containing protein n=1 Tax=Fusarium culmorum TaxID=5516 RepID=A0A7S8D2F7_FUSCU|nr:hypothetical protein HYE67_002985 [Fusarium culmorum]
MVSSAWRKATPTGTTSTPPEINEPTGRAVIFLIQTTDDEQRTLHRRASSGFVGNNNPNVCTFATTFNLAEGQLLDRGVPIYYSGERVKALAGQDTPPRGSITTEFSESGNILTFKNAELPNGQAGFCQDTEGQVFITFSTIPPGCTPISLIAYDVNRCQNGRLIGLDELASSSSEIIPTGATSMESTAITEEALTTQPGTTETFTSQPIDSASRSSGLEGSATQYSSSTSDTFISQISEISESSQQEPTETSSQTGPIPTELEDSATLSSASVTSQLSTLDSSQASTTTDIKTVAETTSTATDTIETSSTVTDVSETSTQSVESTTTEVGTTSTDIGSDTTTEIEQSTTTEVEDTTTIPEELTTTEAETTSADFTTEAQPTTATEAAGDVGIACGEDGATSQYRTNGVTFEQLCQTGDPQFSQSNFDYGRMI